MTVEQLTPAMIAEMTREVLQALGTPQDAAALVAESLVGANLVGHDSHGIVRLREYASFVDRGLVVPDARPLIASAFGAVQVVDGAHGWGQLAGRFAVETAAHAATEHGIAAVAIRNCNHIGRIGEYAEQLAERGFASIIWCNADPSVAPFGGIQRMLGTNPFAVGIPVEGSHPFILDFATAATAEGKLRVARATGASAEPGSVIDAHGRPSTDPNAFYEGGALLPFGGHKGYGLSMFIELLGGALSGNHPSVTSRYEIGNGAVLIAMRPEAFEAMDFAADVQDTIDALRASTPADPARPVLVPGDVEAAQRDRRRELVPVAEEIWADVRRLRDELTARAR